MKENIAIIGAGLGGISTAARLAKLNYNVTVYEKNNLPGGVCQNIYIDNARFDQGPTMLIMKEYIEELFDFLDKPLNIKLNKCNDNCHVYFDDNSVYNLNQPQSPFPTGAQESSMMDENKIPLPFIVVNTSSKAVIQCEMNADRTEVMFDFNMPFEINDDNEILKRLGL